MSDKQVNITANDGAVYPQRLVDNGDGTYSLQVAIVGGGGGGGSAVPPVMAVIDSAVPPKRWVMVTDYSASPAAVTFYEFGTVTAGTPTLPVTPDDDANAATEATQLLVLAALNAIKSNTGKIDPAAWNGTSFDAREYGDVTIYVTTTPSTKYDIQSSPDGVAWYPVTGVTSSLTTTAEVHTSFTGAISIPGRSYIRLNGGTGGVFQIGGAA